MMRVQRHGDATGRVPFQIAAPGFVLGHVGRQRPAIGQILTRAEPLGVKDGARDRTIGPLRRRIAEVEPHADAAAARLDAVARIGEVDRRGQRFDRAELQNDLAVDAFAFDVGQRIGRFLRNFIDIRRPRPIDNVRTLWPKRPPVVLGAQKCVAETHLAGIYACLALLIDARHQDAELVAAAEGGAKHARYFGSDVLTVILRGIEHAARGDRSTHAGAVEWTRGDDVDRRPDAARWHGGATRLVDFDGGDAL